MSAMIEVTDEDIAYAEGLLLSEGQYFDPERRDFIRDFTTLDLHAVPGSGKTTALLAKLVILETKLPLSQGAGVLVLSHTNVAVDEIYDRIGKHCPKLLRYPNFVGTIQSFVDKFLAVPFYSMYFNNKLVRIDDEIYFERLSKYNLPQGATSWLSKKNDPSNFLRQIRFDRESNLISKIDGTKESFDLKDQESDTYKALKRMKVRILKQGVLCFDDAYFLAMAYLSRVPEIIEVLRNRFSLVFIDEMQDMDVHQHNLLEEIFYDNQVIYQRIGDRNQAIYSGSPKLENVWLNRDKVLRISGSHRLTANTAMIVENFALERGVDFELKGLRSGDIKPYIILYDDEKIDSVIGRFGELINEFRESGKIIVDDKSRFKAVGWVKQTDSSEKLSIGNFEPNFNPFPNKKRIDYETFTGYLKSIDKSSNAFRSIQNTLIRAILKVLRLESVTTLSGRPFTKNGLFKYIKSVNEGAHNTLKTNLFSWSMLLIEGKLTEVKDRVNEYIIELLGMFDKEISQSEVFLTVDENISEVVDSEMEENNVIVEGIKIEVGTVHSVKGQTTTAIIYLETFFNNDSGKSYESERLAAQFKGTPIPMSVGKRIKQSAKMVYVGLSRPTDFLCIAIHKNRFNNYLSDIDREIWVVDDTLI